MLLLVLLKSGSQRLRAEFESPVWFPEAPPQVLEVGVVPVFSFVSRLREKGHEDLQRLFFGG